MNNDELFIDGNNLPYPLDKNKVYDLLDKMHQGNDLARDILIEHNIRLVLKEVVNKFRTVDYDKKDLVSIGNIGLMKAISTFDISKNVEFSTYAIKCIDNEILMFLRKAKREQNIDSLNKMIVIDDEGNKLELGDILCSSHDFVDEYTAKETYQIIRTKIDNLPERDREFLLMSFGFYNDRTYTQNEIAEKYNVRQSYVSMQINRIVKKIINNLEEEGIVEFNDTCFECSKVKTKVYN